MSKFCQNCGKEMNDADLVCSACGTADAASATPASNPVAGAVNKVNDYVSKAKANPRLLAIIGGGVVLLLIVGILLSTLLGGSPRMAVIDRMIDVQFNGKLEAIKDMAPKAYWDWYEDENDMSIDEYIDEMEENEYVDQMKEAMEEMYGDNLRISAKLLEEKQLSEKKLNAIRDGLKDNYDIAKKSVTEAWEIEVEMSIRGSEDEETDEVEYIVAKIDGGWYRVSESGYISLM